MSDTPETTNDVEPNEEQIREANETIVGLVREQRSVKDEADAARKGFKEQLDDIQSRMDGQLRVLDELLRGPDPQAELPFNQAPADGSGEVVQAQDGTVLAGEEAFAIANGDAVNEPEDAEAPSNVVPLREDSVSSVPFMADGMEHEPEVDVPVLDDLEIALIAKDGKLDLAAEHYVSRTGATRAVADGEIKAWQAGQQPVDPVPAEKTKRGRRVKG